MTDKTDDRHTQHCSISATVSAGSCDISAIYIIEFGSICETNIYKHNG